MIRIDDLEDYRLGQIDFVLTDIDDTLSTEGKLTAPAFEAIWRLSQAGIRVIAVTGRPAGWCDHIARFWPVDAVVGENGAFYFWHDGDRLLSRYVQDEGTRDENRRRLGELRARILREFPGAALASDQFYRESDLAIDFCEDVRALPREEVVRIKETFEAAGAQAKISSIHVNGWFGDFDKLSTCRLWASERLGVDLDAERERFAYCGDSPNDEPMFAFFPLSFGMANVREFLTLMEHEPAILTNRPCGAGFVEVANRILVARSEEI